MCKLSSTVKIDETLKKEIDKLQAKLILKLGQKISQQELLRKVVNYVIKNEKKFFDNFILTWDPMSDDEWNSLTAFITDFGYETSEETIDKELYGDKNNSS
ncbi:MAG: hypothetical protein HeimC3_39120 [Candidatus Heimdallarchaeota archaeon LC_3]|nr:MAG: hypothetical protein HeimC3_39120 [Candidatus Heimdallarchaeota archaeon LC_3]